METPQNNNSKEQDISLQSPGEANRDKHINFLEKEEQNSAINDEDNAGDANFTPIYLNSDTTLQFPDEKKHDESINPNKNNRVEASEDDLDETTFDRRNTEERTNAGE